MDVCIEIRQFRGRVGWFLNVAYGEDAQRHIRRVAPLVPDYEQMRTKGAAGTPTNSVLLNYIF